MHSRLQRKWRSTVQQKKISGDGVAAQKSTTTSGTLNFFSPEFNRIDDLDDNTGNFREFQSLAGIVTSDMRHQQKKNNSPQTVSPIEKAGECHPQSDIHEGVPAAAPVPLTVVSKGRLLIIDSDLERALTCAERLTALGLECILCVVNNGNTGFSATRIDDFAFIETDSIALTGFFGGFVASVRGVDGTVKHFSTSTGHLSTLTGQMSSLTGRNLGSFDLVLDLQATPSFVGQLLPVGYYAPGDDPHLLEAALVELPEMRGRFKRPQFLAMQESACLHRRMPNDDCRQCIDICPVAALTLKKSRVVVDQHRCQGCGVCALICPADVITLPSQRKELLSQLERFLSESINSLQVPTQIIFHDREMEELSRTIHTHGKRVVFFAVEEIALVSLDVQLAALASGADCVTMVWDPQKPAAIRDALERQVRLGSIIVEALQMSPESLRFTEGIDTLTDAPQRAGRSIDSGGIGFDHDKRTLTRLAVDHLFKQYGNNRQPVIELPEDAPFGTIAVEASCSLCMACVGACPAKALIADGAVPRLSLIEARCHQCGICREACPENCLTLQPRLLCDATAASAPTVLHAAEPFQCVECGAPFASAAMISRMQEKLAGHWMYSSSRQTRRLQMCRTCRTRDVFNTGDYQT